MELYLITGFLGAGKTTFLKNMIHLLAPKQMYIIINEFGKAGVDGKLLTDMGATLAEINNGSIFCACRLDQFETELHRAVCTKPDIILVEASGLSDPSNVWSVLRAYPDIDFKGSICIVDATRIEKVFSTARVCPKQLAVSSLVLLNKSDTATLEQSAAAKKLVLQANPAAHIECTSYGAIYPEWLHFLKTSIDVEENLSDRDLTLQKAYLIIDSAMTKEQLQKCLAMLCEDTYRIKGFVKLEGGTFFVDCTGPLVQLTPWQGDANNHIVLLAGQGMPMRKAIKSAIEWYSNLITKEE